jgi:glutamine amidotransferase
VTIAIIDYGSGNLRSAEKSFARMANGATVTLTADPDVVAKADHIVLPGVGAFGDCAQGLRAIDGMVEALSERVLNQARPFLGICVGMQLLCAKGHERGLHEGLGWLDAQVHPLEVPPELKVPHMGWNNLRVEGQHKVLDGLDGEDVYFVHGFAARFSGETSALAASVDYGGPVVAAVARDTFIGTQFHPEKSQQAGLRLIENFLEWRP